MGLENDDLFLLSDDYKRTENKQISNLCKLKLAICKPNSASRCFLDRHGNVHSTRQPPVRRQGSISPQRTVKVKMMRNENRRRRHLTRVNICFVRFHQPAILRKHVHSAVSKTDCVADGKISSRAAFFKKQTEIFRI